MKLFANENVPAASVRVLRANGHDVSSVGEDSPGETDAANLEASAREGRILITFDRDYGELIFKRRLSSPPGVIYLRFEPDYPEHAGEILAALLVNQEIVCERRFTVVGSDLSIRQRPLPLSAES